MNITLSKNMKGESEGTVAAMMFLELSKKYPKCNQCSGKNLLFISKHADIPCNNKFSHSEGSSHKDECQHCLFKSFGLCLPCILFEDYGFFITNTYVNKGCYFYIICDDCLKIQQDYPIKPAYLNIEQDVTRHYEKECPVCNNAVCLQYVHCSKCNTFRRICKSGDVDCCIENCKYACYECSKE